MQTFWSRFWAGFAFLIALATLQVLRIISSSYTPAEALGQYIILVIILLGLPALILSIYWLRARPGRARRRWVEAERGRRWIGDVRVDAQSLELLANGLDSGPTTRDLALVVGKDAFELWAVSGDLTPAAGWPFESVDQITANPDGPAASASDIWVTMNNSETAAMSLVSSRLFGMYPASPSEVAGVVDGMRALVEGPGDASHSRGRKGHDGHSSGGVPSTEMRAQTTSETGSREQDRKPR